MTWLDAVTRDPIIMLTFQLMDHSVARCGGARTVCCPLWWHASQRNQSARAAYQLIDILKGQGCERGVNRKQFHEALDVHRPLISTDNH